MINVQQRTVFVQSSFSAVQPAAAPPHLSLILSFYQLISSSSPAAVRLIFSQAASLEMKLGLLLLLLPVCHLGLTEEPSPAAPHVSVDQDGDDSDPSCGGALSPEQRRAIGGAVEQLGLQLLEKLPISPQQPNVMLSPLSLALGLAQLALGARNETEKLLLQSLHVLQIPCFHHILGKLLPHFSHQSVEVAARMYLRPGFHVKLSFVEDSLSRYRSQPVPLVSMEEVNQWVENVTNGHIANFLESIPHDVVLMLMNAVHFKGEWQTRFDPSVTSKGVFYLDNQNSVPVDMMKSAQYPLRLLDDAELEAQVASFPFKGNTSFLVVLPRGNVSSLLPKLNISDLYRRLPQEKTMQVNLPKVKLQYRQELQEALTSMGLGSLFSAPDLSGISDFPLRVTGVRHATAVELSEDGVEASATTAVTSMRSVSLFSVNSPFLFALVDHASLAPLFMGVVTNPAPDHDPMLRDDPHGNANATVSDQKRDGADDQVAVEDGSRQPCSAPSGGKHGDELQKKMQEDQTCLKADDPVPA